MHYSPIDGDSTSHGRSEDVDQILGDKNLPKDFQGRRGWSCKNDRGRWSKPQQYDRSSLADLDNFNEENSQGQQDSDGPSELNLNEASNSHVYYYNSKINHQGISNSSGVLATDNPLIQYNLYKDRGQKRGRKFYTGQGRGQQRLVSDIENNHDTDLNNSNRGRSRWQRHRGKNKNTFTHNTNIGGVTVEQLSDGVTDQILSDGVTDQILSDDVTDQMLSGGVTDQMLNDCSPSDFSQMTSEQIYSETNSNTTLASTANETDNIKTVIKKKRRRKKKKKQNGNLTVPNIAEENILATNAVLVDETQGNKTIEALLKTQVQEYLTPKFSGLLFDKKEATNRDVTSAAIVPEKASKNKAEDVSPGDVQKASDGTIMKRISLSYLFSLAQNQRNETKSLLSSDSLNIPINDTIANAKYSSPSIQALETSNAISLSVRTSAANTETNITSAINMGTNVTAAGPSLIHMASSTFLSSIGHSGNIVSSPQILASSTSMVPSQKSPKLESEAKCIIDTDEDLAKPNTSAASIPMSSNTALMTTSVATSSISFVSNQSCAQSLVPPKLSMVTMSDSTSTSVAKTVNPPTMLVSSSILPNMYSIQDNFPKTTPSAYQLNSDKMKSTGTVISITEKIDSSTKADNLVSNNQATIQEEMKQKHIKNASALQTNTHLLKVKKTHYKSKLDGSVKSTEFHKATYIEVSDDHTAIQGDINLNQIKSVSAVQNKVHSLKVKKTLHKSELDSGLKAVGKTLPASKTTLSNYKIMSSQNDVLEKLIQRNSRKKKSDASTDLSSKRVVVQKLPTNLEAKGTNSSSETTPAISSNQTTSVSKAVHSSVTASNQSTSVSKAVHSSVTASNQSTSVSKTTQYQAATAQTQPSLQTATASSAAIYSSPSSFTTAVQNRCYNTPLLLNTSVSLSVNDISTTKASLSTSCSQDSTVSRIAQSSSNNSSTSKSSSFQPDVRPKITSPGLTPKRNITSATTTNTAIQASRKTIGLTYLEQSCDITFTSTDGRQSNKLIFKLNEECRLIIKSFGNIALQKSDILVGVLGPDLELKKTKVGQAFLMESSYHQKEVRYWQSINHIQDVLMVRNPIGFKCQVICHVVLTPWKVNQSRRQLKTALEKVFDVADEIQAQTISIPPLGHGQAFKFPANYMVRWFLKHIKFMCNGQSLKKVILLAPSLELFNEFKNQGAKYLQNSDKYNEPEPSINLKDVLLTVKPQRGTLNYMKRLSEQNHVFPSYWSTSKSEPETGENSLGAGLVSYLASWFTKSSKKVSQVKLVDVDEKTISAIKKLVLGTLEINKIGHGADAVGVFYTDINIIDVKRIENPSLFAKYHMKRKEILEKMIRKGNTCINIGKLTGSKGKVLTQTLLAESMKKELYSEINEHYLFHGTKAEAVVNINKNGFNPKLSKQMAMFGQGIYAAEKFTKADQYSDDKLKRKPNGTNLTVVLVRMLLGDVFICNENHKWLTHKVGRKFQKPPCTSCLEDVCECWKNEHFDSVVGDGKWLFREFVVYEGSQCYPEYLITYQRS